MPTLKTFAKITCALALLLNGTASIFSPANQAWSASSSCYDVEVLFARGSGGELNGTDYQSFITAVNTAYHRYLPSLTFHFYELGSRVIDGHQYTAPSIEDPLVFIGAAISAGQAFTYGQSTREGSKEILAYINQTSARCPNTKYVLGGYSQGAQVISSTVPKIPADKLIYAATFGDPKLYLPEGVVASGESLRLPPACSGQSLSNYRIDVPDCMVDAGVLGPQIPYQTEAYIDKLGTWCNNNDFFCGSNLNVGDDTTELNGYNNPLLGLIKPHLMYSHDGSHTDAAQIIAAATAQAFPTRLAATSSSDQLTIPVDSQKNTRDTAILIDTTNSMMPVIGDYKAEALRLARTTLELGGRVALYEFRDLKDPFRARQLCDFSCTLPEFSKLLDGLKVKNGGDEPESALSAAKFAMKGLNWRTNAIKSVVILTDAPYLNPDRDGTTLNDVVRLSYQIDPVNFYVIAPAELQSDWADLVTQTNGQFYNQGQHSQIELSTDYLISRSNATVQRADTLTGQPTLEGYSTTFSADPAGSTSPDDVSNVGSDSAGAAAQTGTLRITLPSSVAYSAIVVDDALLALAPGSTVTITDLPANATVTLTPYSTTGLRGQPTAVFNPKEPATADHSADAAASANTTTPPASSSTAQSSQPITNSSQPTNSSVTSQPTPSSPVVSYVSSTSPTPLSSTSKLRAPATGAR